jgi:hypothetical protein
MAGKREEHPEERTFKAELRRNKRTRIQQRRRERASDKACQSLVRRQIRRNFGPPISRPTKSAAVSAVKPRRTTAGDRAAAVSLRKSASATTDRPI